MAANNFFNSASSSVIASIDLRAAFKRLLTDKKIPETDLATELGLSSSSFAGMLNATDNSLEAWIALRGDSIIEVLGRYGMLPEDAAIKEQSPPVPPGTVLIPWGTDKANENPFADNAEDIAADETRDKIELFAWADGVLGLSEAELELEIDRAAKRFQLTKDALRRIVKARRNDRKKQRHQSGRHQANDEGSETRFYGPDFKTSTTGVFTRRFDADGSPFWDRISTTRIEINAFTRDQRGENWGTYVLNNQSGRRYYEASYPTRPDRGG